MAIFRHYQLLLSFNPHFAQYSTLLLLMVHQYLKMTTSIRTYGVVNQNVCSFMQVMSAQSPCHLLCNGITACNGNITTVAGTLNQYLNCGNY